jgi:hypothetical protein
LGFAYALRFQLLKWFLDFRRRSFFDYAGRFLNELDTAFCGGLFLRKILIANFLGELFGNGIGGNTYIDTLAAHLFNEPLSIKL